MTNSYSRQFNEIQRLKKLGAMYAGNKAYNKGLWNAIPWYKKPLYFILKAPESPTDI